MGFSFYQPEKLVDRDLELVLVEKIFPEANEIADVPVYKFEMRTTLTAQKLGRVNFRVGNTEDIIMYAGHFGWL